MDKFLVCHILFKYLIHINDELVYETCHVNDMLLPYFYTKRFLVDHYCKSWKVNVTIRSRFQRYLRHYHKIRLCDNITLYDDFTVNCNDIVGTCVKEFGESLDHSLLTVEFGCEKAGFQIDIVYVSANLTIFIYQLVYKYHVINSNLSLEQLKF